MNIMGRRRRRDYVIKNGELAQLPLSDTGESSNSASGSDAEDDAMWHGAGMIPGVSLPMTSYPRRFTQSGSRLAAAAATVGSGPSKYVVKCEHIQDPFRVGPYTTLLITGAHDVFMSDLDSMMAGKFKLQTPDLGIYLTAEWEQKMKAPKLAMSNPGLPSIKQFGTVPVGLEATIEDVNKRTTEYLTAKAESEKKPDVWRWPFVLVGWPDRGVIATEVAVDIVQYMLAQLKAGLVIDTGCAGAHGRTGTLLAMLLIEAEGLDPEAAIIAVRQRHCHKAIESDVQVRAIFNFAGKFATAEEVKRLG
jgi:protein-tyrosine phosphatase